MTESKEYIRAKISNRMNADCSSVEAKNNRFHYRMKFEESIGWDWAYSQMMKANAELEVDLEPWEIHPSGMAFEIEVREVERRADIDDSQHGLGDF